MMTNIMENSGLGKPKMEANTSQATMALPATKATEIIRAIKKNKFRVPVGRDALVGHLLPTESKVCHQLHWKNDEKEFAAVARISCQKKVHLKNFLMMLSMPMYCQRKAD